MLQIHAMSNEECKALLTETCYGHLGCTRDGHPYVTPMNYAFVSDVIYFLTTEGTKTEYIAANSEVCLQVEDVRNQRDWRSVMVIGAAKRLKKPDEIRGARALLDDCNANLEPAINLTSVGSWKRGNEMAVYRILPVGIYGRKTVE